MKTLLSLLAICCLSVASVPTGQLCLQINNIDRQQGKIWIAVYDSEQDFLNRERARLFESEVGKDGYQKIDLGALPHGEYAVAIFHDVNANNEFDFNWFGIPTEPFAFSKGVSSKWRKPTFDEVKFIMNQRNKVLTLQLNTWHEL